MAITAKGCIDLYPLLIEMVRAYYCDKALTEGDKAFEILYDYFRYVDFSEITAHDLRLGLKFYLIGTKRQHHITKDFLKITDFKESNYRRESNVYSNDGTRIK